jgi:YidC/Oxa1 family membrane protein insertase
MDIKKTLIIIGLVVTGWMLITAWEQDYGQDRATTVAENIAPTTAHSPTNPVTRDEGYLAPSRPQENGSDNSKESPETAASPSNLVMLEGKTLRMSVDLKGGNIRSLSLSEYPISLESEDPLPLLADNNHLFYVAQSGLTGTDGLEKKSWLNYQVTRSSGRTLELTHETDQFKVVKSYLLPEEGHTVQVSLSVTNKGTDPVSMSMFGQLVRDNSPDITSTGGFGANAYLGAAFYTEKKPYFKIPFDEFNDGFSQNLKGGWLAYLQHYFLAAWIPPADENNFYSTRVSQSGKFQASFVGEEKSIAPGATATYQAQLYAGPKLQATLAELSPGLDLTVDYGILWFIGKPIASLLALINSLVGNWGWTIVLLTLVIKSILYPFSAASYRSMARMRLVSPKLQALKERYGDDRQKMSQAMMELYKKEKINPLGGCLPILLQMPVFISLYWVLLESVEIRQADWLWIMDLSIRDPLFILPLLMGGTMFLQQMLNPAPPDPMQARVMKMLPVIFTVFFLFFPAGLVLYWLVNNILSIAQQWFITWRLEKEGLGSKG